MFGMEYGKRVIINFLWNEGTLAHDIAAQFQAQLGEHAYQLRTIRFCIPEAWLSRQDLHDEIRSGRPIPDELDAKIRVRLDKSPIKSTHLIAERPFVAHPIVLRHLHDFIRCKLFHLHSVPHLLTAEMYEKRKEHAIAILPFLHTTERDGWSHLVIGHES
jgi:hypothetical protein